MPFDATTVHNLRQWLEGNYDENTKKLVRQLVQEDQNLVEDAFFTSLKFGTGGLRGLMGIGTNRVNEYTLRAATQGLANYILKHSHRSYPHAVFIGYDTRHHSRKFAEESAKVLAANEISVYIFKEVRPTPLLSFSCRYNHCVAGIMITASHNPPSYNGYKVYWSDGGQITSPRDEEIMKEIEKITDPSMVRLTPSFFHPKIKEVDDEMDEAYLKAISNLQHSYEDNQKFGNLIRVVYTSLHGTGLTMVPKVLSNWGFTQISIVEKQSIFDENFSTVSSPNPEEYQALKMGIEQLVASKGDILIATDPDADRMGVVCMHQGKPYVFNGNQIACICLEHICESLTSKNRLPPHACFIKTIATTELFSAICNHYNRHCFNVLTGFKHIAEKILEFENDTQPNPYQFIFGGEESYGYLLGTHVRDKDAMISSSLICEAALQAKLKGKTLVDKLFDLYRLHGIYQECLVSLDFEETKEGKEKIAFCMNQLRKNPLQEIDGVGVDLLEDYLDSIRHCIRTGRKDPLKSFTSNVLAYLLKDNSKILIRPSGTEAKVKLYLGIKQSKFSTIEEGIQSSLQKCQQLSVWFKQYFKTIK